MTSAPDIPGPDSDPAAQVRFVLSSALKETICHTRKRQKSGHDQSEGRRTGSIWIESIARGFHSVYSNRNKYHIFPSIEDSRPLEIWDRKEYLHDIAVVECDDIVAPFSRRSGKRDVVRSIRRIWWQVESEIENSALELAIDASKLLAGSAYCQLLVATLPWRVASGPDIDDAKRWRNFVQSALSTSTCDQFFVAFIPSFSTRSQARELWDKGEAFVHLYKRNPEANTGLSDLIELDYLSGQIEAAADQNP